MRTSFEQIIIATDAVTTENDELAQCVFGHMQYLFFTVLAEV